MFEFGIDFRSRQFLGNQEIAILAGDADGVTTKLVDLADDLFVDRARENHLHDFHGRRVGHAQAGGEFALDAEPAEQARDLRAAAMHHDRLHARLFEHHDVARKAFGKLRIDHRVAAIFDDHGRLIVALHIGQRLGKDLRGDARFPQAFVEIFVRIGSSHSPSQVELVSHSRKLRCGAMKLQGCFDATLLVTKLQCISLLPFPTPFLNAGVTIAPTFSPGKAHTGLARKP